MPDLQCCYCDAPATVAVTTVHTRETEEVCEACSAICSPFPAIADACLRIVSQARAHEAESASYMRELRAILRPVENAAQSFGRTLVFVTANIWEV